MVSFAVTWCHQMSSHVRPDVVLFCALCVLFPSGRYQSIPSTSCNVHVMKTTWQKCTWRNRTYYMYRTESGERLSSSISPWLFSSPLLRHLVLKPLFGHMTWTPNFLPGWTPSVEEKWKLSETSLRHRLINLECMTQNMFKEHLSQELWILYSLNLS